MTAHATQAHNAAQTDALDELAGARFTLEDIIRERDSRSIYGRLSPVEYRAAFDRAADRYFAALDEVTA